MKILQKPQFTVSLKDTMPLFLLMAKLALVKPTLWRDLNTTALILIGA
jgi:hypothetical protein